MNIKIMSPLVLLLALTANSAQAVLLTYEFAATLNSPQLSQIVDIPDPGNFVIVEDLGTYDLNDFQGFTDFAAANSTVHGRFSYDTEAIANDNGFFNMNSFEYTLNVDGQEQLISGGAPVVGLADFAFLDVFNSFNALPTVPEYQDPFFTTFDLATGNAEHPELIHTAGSVLLIFTENLDIIQSEDVLPELLDLNDIGNAIFSLSFAEPNYDVNNPQLGELLPQIGYSISELSLVDTMSDISVSNAGSLALLLIGLLSIPFSRNKFKQ